MISLVRLIQWQVRADHKQVQYEFESNEIDNEERAGFPKLCNSDQFFNHGTVIFERGLLLTVQE